MKEHTQYHILNFICSYRIDFSTLSLNEQLPLDMAAGRCVDAAVDAVRDSLRRGSMAACCLIKYQICGQAYWLRVPHVYRVILPGTSMTIALRRGYCRQVQIRFISLLQKLRSKPGNHGGIVRTIFHRRQKQGHSRRIRQAL